MADDQATGKDALDAPTIWPSNSSPEQACDEPRWYETGMIRRCHDGELREILETVNDAVRAYEGVIPADCWREPYMQ